MNIRDVAIERLLIHKPPMLMIDRAISDATDGVTCEVEIRPDNVFCTEQGVPAFVAVEFMAQAIGVFDGWNRLRHRQGPRIGYLVGTRQLELHCDYFFPGQILTVGANIAWDGDHLVQFRCYTADKNGNLELARATINVYTPDRDSSEGLL